MKKKPNPNNTQVAHDCIAYAMLLELQDVLYWRRNQNCALPMMAEMMARILEREIPDETFQRMVKADFVRQMHHRMADSGCTPYTAFQILNSKV